MIAGFTLLGGSLPSLLFDRAQNLQDVWTLAGSKPIALVKKDHSIVVLLQSIAVFDKFDTRRLTAKERASRVVAQYVLPSLRVFRPVMDLPKVGYLGMVVSYGSQDFGKGPGDMEGETVARSCPTDGMHGIPRGPPF